MNETTFNLNTKNGPVEFTSTLTDNDVANVLGEMTRSEFALSLLDTYANREWSAKQRAWAHYLAWERTQPKPVTGSGLESIVGLFDAAAEHRKFPRLTFELQVDGETTQVVLKRAGMQSRNPGAVNITNGEPFGSTTARWFGRIDRDGTTKCRQPDVVAFLEALARDPEGVAAEHGKATGTCCFCHRTLTDPQSISAGYGPICAQNWNLTAAYAAAAG